MGFIPIDLIPVTSDQAWNLMREDFRLRETLMLTELNPQFQQEINAIYAQRPKAGGASYYMHAHAKRKLDQTDLLAQRYFDACLEIWAIQSRPRCRAFYLAILHYCLIPLFDIREQLYSSEVRLRYGYDGENQNSIVANCRSFRREMGKLRSKWSYKIEIASRDNEHQRRLAGEKAKDNISSLAPIPPASTQIRENENQQHSTFTWRELAVQFRGLQAEVTGPNARAMFTRTKWEGTGSIDEEWLVCGDPVRSTQFVQFASIAAQKLGFAPSEEMHGKWLDRVREWMQEKGLEKDTKTAWCSTGTMTLEGRTGETWGLDTEQISELSAMFCMELIARGTPESAVSSSSAAQAVNGSGLPNQRDSAKFSTARNGASSKKTGRPQIRDREFIRYAGTLWRESQDSQNRVESAALKRIATALDKSRFSNPSEWLERNAASKLKAHNQKYGNSQKKILNWSDIVVRNEPDFKSPMRKLLSRCAGSSANWFRDKN